MNRRVTVVFLSSSKASLTLALLAFELVPDEFEPEPTEAGEAGPKLAVCLVVGLAYIDILGDRITLAGEICLVGPGVDMVKLKGRAAGLVMVEM